MQSVPVTTKVVSSNLDQAEAYSIQHYVIKFVSDLRQVGCFLQGPPVSFTNKTDRHDIIEILLKVALNAMNQANLYYIYFCCWLMINSHCIFLQRIN